MKAFLTMKRLVIPVLLVVGIITLASCVNPTGPATTSYGDGGEDAFPGAGAGTAVDGTTGSLLVSIGSGGGFGASTVFPTLDVSAVASYRVVVTDGPAGAPVPAPVFIAADPLTGQPASALAIGELVPGAWTVDVEGFDSSGGLIVHGTAEDVSIVAGGETAIVVSLGYIADGEGGFDIVIEWPTAQKIQNVEYRLDDDPWTVISGSQFSLSADGETTSLSISESARAAGVYWFTVRLDAGALATWERYRAMVDEKLYIYRNVVTTETIALTADHFSFRPPDPGSFEDLEDSGAINIDPDDGAITYNPDGYDLGDSAGDITVDPDDGSITFENNGERGAYLATPGVSKARLELSEVNSPTGNRWEIAFHGELDEQDRFSGYTVRFNLNPGTVEIVQWLDGAALGAATDVSVKNAINLQQTLDAVTVEVDGPQVVVTLVQGGITLQVFNVGDLTAIAPDTTNARTEGILGLQAGGSTSLTIGGLKLFVLD